MNRGELLTRMFDAYDKKITPQRMYYYEEWAKTLPIESVKHIIDSAVKSFDYLPTVNKLYGLATLADSIDYKQRNVYFGLLARVDLRLKIRNARTVAKSQEIKKG